LYATLNLVDTLVSLQIFCISHIIRNHEQFPSKSLDEANIFQANSPQLSFSAKSAFHKKFMNNAFALLNYSPLQNLDMNPQFPNNPRTDWFLISNRYVTGPFSQCRECRMKNEVLDKGAEGCVAMIHFCPDCRQLNKHISYKQLPKGNGEGTSKNEEEKNAQI
jgi:hypothetical protein